MHYSTTIPREAAPPGSSHVSRGSNHPDARLIIAEWKACPTSRALAIAVACIQCRETPDTIRKCPNHICGLYRLRPYQADVAPSGKPHVQGHFEEPDGLTPGEADDD